MRDCQAAVVQAAPILFDTERTLVKFADLLSQAKQKGADLAVFPEAFIGGYPKGFDFGAVVGSRSPEGRALFQRYYDGGVEVPGPVAERLCAIVGDIGLETVVGVIERDGGTLYCTVLAFSAEGELLGKRRKLMPTAMERLIWGFGDGSTLGAWDGCCGKTGAVICWENYMPMLRMSQYAQGVELYCAPTVDDRESWASTMRTVALEGRCFVLSACQYMRHKDIHWNEGASHDADGEKTLIRGGSIVVSPLGEVLAGPVFDSEKILTAHLDSSAIARGKFDFDVVGHYACSDIFDLRVNVEAQYPVEFEASAEDE